jgi:hypothetical protein
MADAEHDRTKVESAPDSTWGATEEAKRRWQQKYGKATEKAAAEAEKEKKD